MLRYNFLYRITVVSMMALRLGMDYFYVYKIRKRWLKRPVSDEKLSNIHRRNGKMLYKQAVYFRGGLIKICQFLSMRMDLLPKEYIEELGKLLDKVEPMKFEVLEKKLVSELKKPFSDVFSEFDREAIAAASLAQVHRAVLKDGREVAVKIQYPGLGRAIQADLIVAGLVLKVIDKVQERFNVGDMYEELAKSLLDEGNFVTEGKYCEEMKKNLSHLEKVDIPAIIWEYTTPSLLVMDFKPGLRLSEYSKFKDKGKNIDFKQIVEVVLEAFAQMIFVHGLFQADPHLGNFLIDVEGDGSSDDLKVVFLDFGMSKRISPALKRTLRKGFIALFKQDTDLLVEAMFEMGTLDETNEDAIRRLTEFAFKEIGLASFNDLQGLDADMIRENVSRIVSEIRGFSIPNDIVLFLRMLSIIEGMTFHLAPDVNFINISAPYVMNFISDKQMDDDVNKASASREPV